MSYKIYKTFDPDTVLVDNGTERKLWSLQILEMIARSESMPGYLRDFAREVLSETGVPVKEPEEPVSDTVTSILGIKIRKGLFSNTWIASIRGKLFRSRSLSEIEDEIRKGV